jgi:membrane protease YdiL (CAAX protease family)
LSFSDRPAAGLYVAAWALGGLGLAGLLIGLMADPPLRGVLVMAGLAAVLLGLAAAVGYQVIARRTRPAERFRGPAPLILFLFQFALVNALSLVIYALGVPLADSPNGFLAATIMLLGGYVAVVWLFGVRTGSLGWRDLVRAQPLDAGRAAFDVAIGGATMLGVALVAGVLGGLLARLIGTEAPAVVPPPDGALEILMVALGAGVLVPIGEELFFRGYSLTAWLRDLGPRSALLRTTLFFALVHIVTLSSDTFLDGVKQVVLVLAVIGPVGFALGWLYLRRGLVAAIAGHAAFNLFAVLMLVLSQYLPAPGTGG